MVGNFKPGNDRKVVPITVADQGNKCGYHFKGYEPISEQRKMHTFFRLIVHDGEKPFHNTNSFLNLIGEVSLPNQEQKITSEDPGPGRGGPSRSASRTALRNRW